MDLKETNSIIQFSAEELARQEAERQTLISQLSAKLAQNPQTSSNLEGTMLKTYDNFVHNEETARAQAKKLGIEYTKTIKNTSARQLVEDIQTNLQETTARATSIILDENTTLEDAQRAANEVISRLDGVSHGAEIAQSFPELVNLNRQQIEGEIKKSIYGRVQDVLQQARIQKYAAEQENIQQEKVGFWGKLFRKEELREKRIENLRLKMELTQRSEASEKDTYSTREMLVDMYMCANTELGGKFTPEMQEVYQAIMSTYGMEKTENFSEEHIQQLVNKRQARSGDTAELPVVPDKRPKVFRKAKAQANMVELENQGLRQKLLKLRTYSLKMERGKRPQEDDAISLFEQRLKGIEVNTREREKEVEHVMKARNECDQNRY